MGCQGGLGGWVCSEEAILDLIEQVLQRQVKQARDALLLYHLEESDDSEDERDLDAYLKRRITDYIESKSVRDLVNEGKLEPQPIFQ